MATPHFLLKGGASPPKKVRAGKFSYSNTSRGEDEVPYDPNDKLPGDSTNSVRPRVSVKSSMVDGCFCNKRGQ